MKCHLINYIHRKTFFNKPKYDILTKIIYLCDWLNVLRCNEQITTIVWNRFKLINPNPENNIENFVCDKLTKEQKFVVDYVINNFKNQELSEFVRLVYSTYPAMYYIWDDWNLPEIANKYKTEFNFNNYGENIHVR